MELLALCRMGFEKEVAAELTQLLAQHQIAGYVKAKENSGFAVFVSDDIPALKALLLRDVFGTTVFIRHWCLTMGMQTKLPASDRATPLIEMGRELCHACDVRVHGVDPLTIDTNEGKSLGRLAKGVGRYLSTELATGDSDWMLQITFMDGESAFVGVYPKDKVSNWSGGVPRLKVPKEAPSRATLKLEEAWHHFVPRPEWEHRLAPSMTAVDLGAAPGGWTWQLVNKSMFVSAVDNGPMDQTLMDSGQVTHFREDGFLFTPAATVDWLVCDIADKPAKVAALIARWASHGWFREAVFNLKLPMTQRYAAVQSARERLIEAASTTGRPFELRFKQLYHDREEVTGHLVFRR